MSVTVQGLSPIATPLFFQLAPAPSTSQEYAQFVTELQSLLLAHNIEISSIVTDGLPAQLSGIQTALSNVHNLPIKPILKPFHIPCLNHRINLVVIHAFQRVGHLSTIRAQLIKFACNSTTTACQSVLHKHCPKYIHTRWLCMSQICSFIRMKRRQIIRHDLMSPRDVRDVMMTEILLLPLLELQLFFESELTKLCDAFPAILRAISEYKIILSFSQFQSKDWLYSISELLCLLHTMTLSKETGKLISLAFSLTSCGRRLLREKRFASAFRLDSPQSALDMHMFVSFCYLSQSFLSQCRFCRKERRPSYFLSTPR